MNQTTEFLQAIEIEKRFSNHLALNKLSISVPKGKVFGLLGPNGAGKTTLIRIINQITAPDSGELFFDGQRLQPSHISRIGYLPEERGLYKKMKVGEQAIYLARLKGLSRADSIARLHFWFEKFEIMPWWNRKVEELSKGMQQKVQFIVTVLHKPELLIFDEPFSGFDPINSELLKREILQLREEGATIIFSTHNMSSVEEVCDSIALIHNAEKVLDGSIDAIRKQYSMGSFEVHFQGSINKTQLALTADYSIKSLDWDGKLTKVILQLHTPVGSNSLLSQMLHLGHVSYFAERIASMHEIFIHAVNQANEQTSIPKL
jgi:ABC-2 type transport system ATP-binding protein